MKTLIFVAVVVGYLFFHNHVGASNPIAIKPISEKQMFMGHPTSSPAVRRAKISFVTKEKATVDWVANEFRIKDISIAKDIAEAIEDYEDNCPCPYIVSVNEYKGTRSECGGRSAYSRPNGIEPLCYPSDVLKERAE